MKQVMTKEIAQWDIRVLQRIRRNLSGIEALAADIRERGLINPITVMEDGEGGYTLIAGLRRLEAMRHNAEETVRATVVSPMDAEALLRTEFAENEQRQGFTVSERLEYARKIRVIEEAKAHERLSFYAREGRKGDSERSQDVDTCPHPQKGKARDAIAKRVGLGSGRQYERALTVATERPDLMEKIDQGETTIGQAYKETVASRSPIEADPPRTASFICCPPSPVRPSGARPA